jgi:hypothetical protein
VELADLIDCDILQGINKKIYRLAKAPYVVVFLGCPRSFPIDDCVSISCVKSRGLVPFTQGDAAVGCQFLGYQDVSL